MKQNLPSFSLCRGSEISIKIPSEKDPSKKTTKYTCPGCGEAVRGPLGLNILCKDCNLTMEPKDRKGEEDD